MVQKMVMLGADLIQGYYYDRPISSDEFEEKYLSSSSRYKVIVDK